jgi:hypothetical protein
MNLPINLPDNKEYTITFAGDAVWMSMGDRYLLFYPILASIKETDIEKMALAMDQDKDGSYFFSFQKIAKDEFYKFFGTKFDCEYDFIIMRLFTGKEPNIIEYKMPENDEDHVKVMLVKLPTGKNCFSVTNTKALN